jgi:hypothetical protein
MQLAHRFSLCLLLTIMTTTAIAQQVELIRDVAIPGTARDLSGIKGELADGTPADRLGGPSGLTWTGTGQVYLWLSDRGPKDGATSHTPRFHEADLTFSVAEVKMA